MESIQKQAIVDKLGMITAALCAVHCVLLPFLLPALPLIASSFFAEEWFEQTMLSLSILIGFWAIIGGFYRYHRKLYPVYLLVLGGLVYLNKGMFGHELEPWILSIGAALIVAAHFTNLKLCRSCKAC